MAFAVRNLSVLAYANGFTLWHYKAGQDPISLVAAPDFFAPARDLFSQGDIVMLSAADGARILSITEAGTALALAA